MNWMECRALIRSDWGRWNPAGSRLFVLREMLWGVGGKFCFWFRLASYVRSRRVWKYSVGWLVYWIYNHYRFKFGIDIAPGTEIGGGFYIGHFGGIVVSPRAVIGRNCNISQGVTIGRKSGGKHPGYPEIGNNVYLGPGAKIIGGIRIGDHCIIGANAVVTKDCPPRSILAGIPARVIGCSDTLSYVNNTQNTRDVL